MKMLARAALGLFALISCGPALADVATLPQVKNASGVLVPSVGAVCISSDGSSCVFGTKQETLSLATANAAAAAQTPYGGDYILTQVCSAYGTVAFQVLGPDGVTYLTAASYTTADTSSGHGVTLGSNAKVRVTLTGTTGCNVTLSRVP